jgi:hypothetical protein
MNANPKQLSKKLLQSTIVFMDAHKHAFDATLCFQEMVMKDSLPRNTSIRIQHIQIQTMLNFVDNTQSTSLPKSS